jgi:hypothetical protein
MELLNEPNKAITKNLFLTSLYESKETIKVKIVNVGNVFNSKMNGKPNIFLDLLILTNFECKSLKLDPNHEPIKNDDGTNIIVKENILNNIVSMPYNLGVNERTRDNYVISNKSNLFNLINYCLIEKEKITANNRQGFSLTEQEIKETLMGMVLNVTCQEITNTNFNPYLKLIPVIE